MKLKFLLLLVISTLALSCKNDNNPTTDGTWNLKNYSVTYFDASGIKVFESKPEELRQFSKIEISGDSVSIPQVVSEQKSQAILAVKSPIKTNPASLVFFNVKKSGNAVSVNFGTASEQNTYRFDIERSTTGVDFRRIATIMAQGISNTVHNYTLTDLYPLRGISYYRLKLVDVDGSFKYSNVVTINVNVRLMKDGRNIYLQGGFVNDTFKKIKVAIIGESKMVWSDEAKNVEYTENGVSKTAASATLNMEFIK